MAGHYAGVFVFDPRDNLVLCVSDSKHPDELKMAGGMSVNGETPEETMHREASEELRTLVQDSIIVHVEVIPGRNGAEDHSRFFFLATRIAGALKKGATWEIEEKGSNGQVVEKLVARWIPIREFADKLFHKQHPAFGAILAHLARERRFYNTYSDLLGRFPAPEGFKEDSCMM
jgi:8-oxo-dGTP pyrophosphatase MutT (NUDIX family)